jgi:hypothetical protein
VVSRDGAGNVLWEDEYPCQVFNRRISFKSDGDGSGSHNQRPSFLLLDLQQPPGTGQLELGAWGQ